MQMRNHRRGFTLLELLVVMSLVSIMLGMSSALFTHFNRGLQLKGAATQLAAILRTAQNHGLGGDLGGRVEFQRQTGMVKVLGYRLVGLWHLEDTETVGALGLHGTVSQARLAPGKIGQGLQLEGKEESMIQLGPWARFGIRQGVTVELWLYPLRPLTNEVQYLLEAGGEYALSLSNDNTVQLERGAMRVSSGSFYAPLYRWTHVQFVDDGRRLTLYCNGVARGSGVSPGFNPSSARGNAVLGRRFRGILDEVKLWAHYDAETLVLPEQVVLREAPEVIAFQQQGRLHPLVHSGPVRLVIESLILQKQWEIRVEVMGTIEYQEKS